jgi:hypothetical protein
MNKPTQNKPAHHSQGNGSANPFARALHESEKSSFGRQTKPGDSSENSMFSQALSKLQSGDFDLSDTDQFTSEQQQLLKEKQQKEVQRKKRHDQINPVDMVDVSSQREQRAKNQSEEVRNELKMLAKDIADFRKEVDITL